MDYSTKNHLVIVCGDMNIDIFKSNNLTERYMDVVNSNGFELGNSDATHFSNEMNHCWTIIWLNATFIIAAKLFQVNVFLITTQLFSPCTLSLTGLMI